jgi:CheY-like chemotaxis protein
MSSDFPYRILLADDDPTIWLSRVRDSLRRRWFNGRAALERSLPDIIILDLRRPDMNDFEFLSIVRCGYAEGDTSAWV